MEMSAIDLKSGDVEKPQGQANGVVCEVLRDGRLIATRGSELVLLEWPSLRVLSSVKMGTRASFVRVGLDGQKVIHLSEQSLICRRTDDLRVLWSRPVDKEIDLNARFNNNPRMPLLATAEFAISRDGSTAVLAPHRSGVNGQQSHYLEVLDASDGSPILRRTLRCEALALSPNGRMLAVGNVVEVGSMIEPTVRLYDVDSGELTASVVHGRVKREQRLLADLTNGVAFSPDNRSLITSALNSVKIWKFKA